MSTTIRPLTLQERQRPAHLTYYGGFKNVSFQIGQVRLPAAAEQAMTGPTPGYINGHVLKGEKVALPVRVPRHLFVNTGYSNSVGSIIGQKNAYGGFDAILVIRSNERLSSFNTKLRTVESLLQTSEERLAFEREENERLGKSSNARAHNQVMLTGIVIAASYEDGDYPRFHVQLRQDADPSNVIPLTYEGKNASVLVARIQRGGFVTVTGEYVYRRLPVYQIDAEGRTVWVEGEGENKERKRVPVLDENGKVKTRIHTYIRILPPQDPSEFDTNFTGPPPAWIRLFSEALAAEKARNKTRHAEAVERNSRMREIAAKQVESTGVKSVADL